MMSTKEIERLIKAIENIGFELETVNENLDGIYHLLKEK